MDKLKIIEKNNPFPESTFRTKSRQICSAVVYTIETNLGQSEVMASAKTAARETKKTFSILITQSLRRSF